MRDEERALEIKSKSFGEWADEIRSSRQDIRLTIGMHRALPLTDEPFLLVLVSLIHASLCSFHFIFPFHPPHLPRAVFLLSFSMYALSTIQVQTVDLLLNPFQLLFLFCPFACVDHASKIKLPGGYKTSDQRDWIVSSW